MPQVFTANRIYSLDSPNEYFKAILVENGRITQLLKKNEFKTQKEDFTDITELSGYIFPGFIDSHIHAISYGRYMDYIDLRYIYSIKELVEKVAEKARNTPEGIWIYGIGWNQEQFKEKRYPQKEDLDPISTTHPIILKRVCTHILLTNSIVLKKAGITRDTPDPEGGIIDRNEQGDPTGILRENAEDLIKILEPKPTFNEQLTWLQKSQRYLNSFGITSIHTLDEECYPVYRAMKDKLTVRVYFCPKHKKLNILYQEEKRAKTGLGDDILRLGRVKLFTDGSLGAQTAAMREPYENSDESGIPIHTKEQFKNLIKEIDDKGWQIETHAIGDKAAEITLDGYEEIYRNNYRPVMTHCQILAKDLIQRIAKSEVIASIQPIFIEQDMDFVEKFIGSKRMKYAYAWKTLLSNGIKCSGGSDAPVDSPNPLYGIYSAVTRQKLNGSPIGGWIPEQKLSMWDAFRLYTYGAAFAEFQEHQKGLLKPGFLADFIILDRDPFQSPAQDIKNIQVMRTFLGGKEVYSRTS
jgi:predicted amidohydrolase YtcJ